jgi:hypothetical protein
MTTHSRRFKLEYSISDFTSWDKSRKMSNR